MQSSFVVAGGPLEWIHFPAFASYITRRLNGLVLFRTPVNLFSDYNNTYNLSLVVNGMGNTVSSN